MFISDTHQPQRLPPSAYHQTDAFERESQAILNDAWYCVGAMGDIPRVGDYLTTEIAGVPILVRHVDEQSFDPPDEANTGGANKGDANTNDVGIDGTMPADDQTDHRRHCVRAFVNVCSHRFCTLASASRGHAEKIRCPYHGWEYADDGTTRRIPDAPSFKPLKKGGLGLKTLSCEVRGSLIFVSVADRPEPIDTFLNGHRDRIESWFGDHWRPMMSYEEVAPCNWKTYLENGLESYHIDTVHAATLVKQPDAEKCQHEFGDRWTSFTVNEDAADAASRWLDTRVHRLMDLPRQPYQHFHIYPTLTFVRLAMFSYLESVIPVSPTSCRIVTRGFVYRGRADRIYSSVLSRGAGVFGRRLLKKIQDEDFGILELNQRGISAPDRPKGGLISAREERIFHFQSYVARHVQYSEPFNNDSTIAPSNDDSSATVSPAND